MFNVVCRWKLLSCVVIHLFSPKPSDQIWAFPPASRKTSQAPNSTDTWVLNTRVSCPWVTGSAFRQSHALTSLTAATLSSLLWHTFIQAATFAVTATHSQLTAMSEQLQQSLARLWNTCVLCPAVICSDSKHYHCQKIWFFTL